MYILVHQMKASFAYKQNIATAATTAIHGGFYLMYIFVHQMKAGFSKNLEFFDSFLRLGVIHENFSYRF